MKFTIGGKSYSIKSARDAVLLFLKNLNDDLGGAVNGTTNKHSLADPIPVHDIVDTSHPFYALIIGIDTYQSRRVPDLKGAAADANAIQEFLEHELRIPGNHVRTLRNEQATRKAIIQALNDFKTDSRIRKGDAIFIFYAGHGTTAKTPIGWEAGDSHIQAIVPYDCRWQTPEGEVQPIPDRTLGALLTKIANEKGDNITVMFDCCHSGSGTRSDEFEPTRLSRGFTYDGAIPPHLDEDIWRGSTSGRAVAIASGFQHSGLRSHVLMAACSKDESALEEHGRGIFTKALLETLTVVGADKITYRDLMQRVPDLPGQNPQCEGANMNRVLFDARAPSQGRVLYRVKNENGNYIMEAGAAHGISHGSEFNVFRDRNPVPTEKLGTLVATEVDALTTTLKVAEGSVDFEISEKAFALQSKTGEEEDLRLYIAVDEQLSSVFEALARELEERTPGHRNIRLVDREQAELAIEVEGDQVVFNITDGIVTNYGFTRMPFTVNLDVEEIYPVIRAAAHYYWHLRRSPKKGMLRDKVLVEFTEVKESDDEWDDDLLPLIKREGDNLMRGNVIDLVIDDTKMYGLKIFNKSNIDLYPSLFYFDNSDLSITDYYQTPVATHGGKVDPPLPRQGSLAIGYGAGGSVPYRYFLRDGQDLDVGFLKLFLSNEPVDLSNVPQPSPFKDRRKGEPEKLKPKLVWDTIIIPVVQRRGSGIVEVA